MTWCDLGQGMIPRRQPGSGGLQPGPPCGGAAAEGARALQESGRGACGKGGCAVPGAGPSLLQGGSPRWPGQREGEEPVPLRGCESRGVTTASQSGQSSRGTWIRPRGSASEEAGAPHRAAGQVQTFGLQAPSAKWAGRGSRPADGPLGRRCSRTAGPLRRENEVGPAWAGPQDLFGRAALGGAQGASGAP